MKTTPQTRILAVCFFLFLAVPARAYYSPEQGRWISRDPIGERGGINLLGIENNNPIDHVDALGLQAEPVPAPIEWPDIRILPDPPPGPVRQPIVLRPGPWLLLAVGKVDPQRPRAFWCPHSDLDQCLDCCDIKYKHLLCFTKASQVSCYCKCWALYSPTPRTKSKYQLIQEWEAIHLQTWPEGAVAHHIRPLADGGADDGSNIQPLTPLEHRMLHSFSGDTARWGRRAARQCPSLPTWLPDPND
jgi:hypothetical protein